MRKIIFSILLIIASIFIIACNDNLTGTNDNNGIAPLDPTSHIPYIEAVTASPPIICLNEEALVKCIANDKNNDIIKYTWEYFSGNIKNIGGPEVVYVPPTTLTKANEIGIVTCQVTDSAGSMSVKDSNSAAHITVQNCLAANPTIFIRQGNSWSKK